MDSEKQTAGSQACDFDVFNGDADGICALHQLRLAAPRDARLITGVKRDIQLLSNLLPLSMSRYACVKGSHICVLDISLDSNLDAVKCLLDQGISMTYFDHHSAPAGYAHPLLDLHWDESPNICTSILVDRYLQGRFRLWAITAAYGDNLSSVAAGMAAQAGLPDAASKQLCELGNLLNYNAYGETEADLHIAPATLYQDLHQYADPFDFINHSGNFSLLQQAYAQDMCLLQDVQPRWIKESGAIYVLPNQAWARRVSGLLANKLQSECVDRSFAVLTEKPDGCFIASVRSCAPGQKTAHGFCSSFATGGGRQAAGGINRLEACDLDSFAARFFAYF
ncbi:hypothetical protein [Undibacterium terreum]|uniref:Acetyltransferase n=1 Tax=Undibacterium terreum TaxID=1224302 RepID=A0A916UZH5_9BURK|nr:hypothetical protein [Undibacterium terreum]GGC93060.1 hypothetical protein GCM10011396_45440 [Undibacterium terreum]